MLDSNSGRMFNPDSFISLYAVLDIHDVGELATLIENGSLLGFDRFNRLGPADAAQRKKALDCVAEYFEVWHDPRQDQESWHRYNRTLDDLNSICMLTGFDVDVVEKVFGDCHAVRQIRSHEDPAVEGDHAPRFVSKAPAASSVQVNRLKKRANALSGVQRLAAKNSTDPECHKAVWAEMVRLAESDAPPPPIIGFVEGEGIKYQDADLQASIKFLTSEAFRKRWERR